MTTNFRSAFKWMLMIGTAASCKSGNKPEIPENMNIVVFLADDLGYGDLGCYGNPIIKTPNIDRFASEGVVLTDFHSAGTVSSPSRAGLLTGRNPYRSGLYYISGSGRLLEDEEITIPEVIKDKGYESCFAGKWHLSVIEDNVRDEPDPGDQGFDYWMGTTLNAFDGPANTKKFIRNGIPVGEVNGWYCDVIVDEAIGWLKKKRSGDKPFFLYVASHEPHTPIAPPPQYTMMYDNAGVDSLEKSISYGRVSRPVEDLSTYKKEYYGTITQLDAAFGRLLEAIDELGLSENTLIIFTSDNGPETPVTLEESLGQWEDPIRDKCFGTPGIYRGMKRYPYEGGHRVPGIVRLPGVIPAGSKSDKLFNGTDIFSTICETVGVPVPPDRNIDGKANFNAFLNREIERDNPEIWFYPHHGDYYLRMPHMSMRHNQYTLIGWLPEKTDSVNLNSWFFENGPARFELYDITNDPQQMHDISEEKPQIVKQLSPVMENLWIEMRDEGKKQ